MHRHGPSCLEGPVSQRTPWQPQGGSPNASGATAPQSTDADPPVRQELVDRIRREIANGTYETHEKWEAALNKLFSRLERE